MKKLVLAVSLLLGSSVLKAEGLCQNWGTVTVCLPFTDISATYLFDGVAKQSLVGAETPLIIWHKLQLTGGAVTSVEGNGAPFVGINLALENPIRNWVILSDIKPGVFFGRDWTRGENLIGVKASVSIFN